jgi:osmotically-inducible protein OsmY
MAAHTAGRMDRERRAAKELCRALDIDELRVSIMGETLHVEGTVSSYRHKLAAVEAVRGLPGIRNVINHLRVAPRSNSSDAAITDAVAAALKADPRLAVADIVVETREGVVELRGSAGTLGARCSAEAAACSVRGVDRVVNRLETDERPLTAAEVERELAADLCCCLDLESVALQICFDGGVVHLSGTVPSARHRDIAESMVRWHSHVTDVVNDLAVEQSSLVADEFNIMGREANAS